MASFSHAVEIPQAPDAVFPWLLEADRVPRWTSALDTYEQLDAGPIGSGSRLRQQLELGGRKYSVELRVTRYDAPSLAETEFSTNGVNVTSTYALAPAGAGTRLTQTMEAKASGFTAKLLIPAVQPVLEKKLKDDLERLRALLS
jgi:carbon monoxide dehydrogenase subunit G